MPDTVQDLIRQAAKTYGVPEALALAVAEQESGFNPTLINPKKVKTATGEEQAIGTFQFLPSTAKLYGIDPMDPRQNIEGGAKYLRDLMDRHEGNIEAVLKEYGGVRTDTTYVPGVVARLKKFQTGPTAPPAAALMPGAIPPSTTSEVAGPTRAEREQQLTQEVMGGVTGAPLRFLANLGQRGIVEPVMGLAQMGSTLLSEGPGAVARQFGQSIVGPPLEHGPKATAARQAGDPATWLKEITAAIPIVGPTLSEIGEQAAQGDLVGAAGGAVGALIPIRGARSAVPAKGATAALVQRSAENSMRKLLEAAGDGSPAAQKAVQAVLPLALDRSLLRVTKGRFQKAVQAAETAHGRNVGRVIAGHVGDEIVPIKPVLDAIDQLRQTKAQNVVPISATGTPIGAAAARRGGPYDRKAVPYNTVLSRQLDRLEQIVRDHGPTIPIRQLVHMRRSWDEIVRGSKQFLNRDDMRKQFEAQAKSAAADAVRQVIDSDPRLNLLAEADKAFSLHRQLYGMIADESFGVGKGTGYYPGFGLGNALMRRLFDMATRAPTWRLMNVATKQRLAEAIAHDNPGVARQILRGVLGGSAAAIGGQTEATVELEPAPP